MKLTRLFVYIIVGLAALLSCTKIEHETVSTNPIKVVAKDAQGENMYMCEYTYSSSNETKTQKNYDWNGSSWELVNDYAYTYSYGEGNYLKYYIVTDKGVDAFRHDYEYDSNYLLKYHKITDYTGSEVRTEEYGFKYELENNKIAVKYTFVPGDNEGEDWKESTKEVYKRDSYGNVEEVLDYNKVNGEYEETFKANYSYYNGYVVNIVVNKHMDSWKKYQVISYQYDQHGRTTSITTETFNLDVSPVTSTTKTEQYYYQD